MVRKLLSQERHKIPKEVFVRTVHNSTITLSIDDALSTDNFLLRVQEKTGISMISQRISFGGKQLETGHTMSDYAIQNHSTLRQVGRLVGGTHPEPDESDQHAFLDLAKRCDWVGVEAVLATQPGLVNVTPSRRWSALHQAAKTNSIDATRMLLVYGADPLALNRDGKTARDLATATDVQEVLGRLIPRK